MTDVDLDWRLAHLAFALATMCLAGATVVQLVLESDVMSSKRLYRLLVKKQSRSSLQVGVSALRPSSPPAARRASDIEVGAMVSSARAFDPEPTPTVNVVAGIRLDPPPDRMYVGKVHRLIHRAVLLAVVGQLVRALDPYGVGGIHNWVSLSAVGNLVSVALIMGASGFFYTTIETSYRLLRRSPPTFLRDMVVTNVVLTFVVGLVTVSLAAATTDTFVTHGVFLLWMAVAEIVVMVFFHIGIKGMELVRLRFSRNFSPGQPARPRLNSVSDQNALLGTPLKAMTYDEESGSESGSDGDGDGDGDSNDDEVSEVDEGPAEPPPRRHSTSTVMVAGKIVKDSTIGRSIVRLKLTRRYAVSIIAVAVVLQVMSAMSTVGEEREEADPHEFDWSLIVFSWLQNLVIVLGLWYAWLPTCYLGAHKALARELAAGQ